MARVNTRRMHLLRDQFFEDGKRLDADHDPAANCWICKQPINYTVPASTTPDSHALDHYHPVSTHPELQEDPSNFRHAHTLCNLKRGAGAPQPGLGTTPAAWW